MPAMFETNKRFYKQTIGLCGFEALNHPSELKILWDTFRSQIAELWFPYDRSIANDRRSVFPYDRRTVCDLRSAIVCDHMEPAFSFFVNLYWWSGRDIESQPPARDPCDKPLNHRYDLRP